LRLQRYAARGLFQLRRGDFQIIDEALVFATGAAARWLLRAGR
jgi:hypothetical protein